MPAPHTPHVFEPMGSGTWCNFCGHSKRVCEYNQPQRNQEQ